MKNIIITLITGVAIGSASPVFGMNPDEKEHVLPCKNHCKTYLDRIHYSAQGLGVTEIGYEIRKLDEGENEKIGEILMKYYPESVSFYKAPLDLVPRKVSTPPTVQLLQIKIEQKHQWQYYGKQVMEALRVDLQEANLLKKDAEMKLEYSSQEPGLKEFYESLGFEETNIQHS